MKDMQINSIQQLKTKINLKLKSQLINHITFINLINQLINYNIYKSYFFLFLQKIPKHISAAATQFKKCHFKICIFSTKGKKNRNFKLLKNQYIFFYDDYNKSMLCSNLKFR